METLHTDRGSHAVCRDDRRHDVRHKVLKAGQISFNRGFSVLECTVRNLSEGGAMLEFASLVGIPSHFHLTMSSGPSSRPCEVRWRTDRYMGVAFLLAS
jgi:hypothetical protein